LLRVGQKIGVMEDRIVSGLKKITPEKVLHTYCTAKDGNRPHLMKEVFSETATLEMVVRTDSIVFPSESQGRPAIADVLARRFGQTYENVYTFCMQRPAAAARHFSCDWLVGMSDKMSGEVRVGCGRYDWTFTTEGRLLADRLTITIEAMQILPPERLDSVLDWLRTLPYPWSSADEIIASPPAIDTLDPVLRYVGRNNRQVPCTIA
jgi:hypothetical protein